MIPKHFLPMVKPTPAVRIEPNWRCKRSGECCTKPEEVVMTKEEAAEIVHAAPPTITLQFRPLYDNFVGMKAGPCPLYAFEQCLVYEVRPYNCRRFACMRPDPKTEPFNGLETAKIRVDVDNGARRLMTRIQRLGQPWAKAHGWGE